MTPDVDPDDDEIDREERAIYAILSLLGIPILAAALIEGSVFDTGPTISLACIAISAVGLLQLRRTRLPRARIRQNRAPRASGTRRRPP